MLDRKSLSPFIIESIKINGGKATVLDISKYIWSKYEGKLRKSGDFFFTWQYDLRWQITELKRLGVLKKSSHKGYWELM